MEPSTRHYIAGEVCAELARQRKLKTEVGKVLGDVRGRVISRQAAWNKLAGEVPFTGEEISALAQWLNVPVAQFFPQTVEVAS